MIQSFDVITVGNISRNRYWGESEERPHRSGYCTCTLVQSAQFRLLVDPSLKEEAAMATELDRRSGVHLSEIDTVFITHAHGDHHYGLKFFPQAQWLAAPPVADQLNETGLYEKRIESVSDTLLDEIDILHTPGHTHHHYSLRFDWRGKSVVIAADAAVTRDFWDDRRGYFNSEDFAAASDSIERLAAAADIVIPGHDNLFFNVPIV